MFLNESLSVIIVYSKCVRVCVKSKHTGNHLSPSGVLKCVAVGRSVINECV